MDIPEDVLHEQVKQTLGDIHSRLTELVEAVNGRLHLLPGPMQVVVVEQTDRTVLLWDRLIQLTYKMLYFPGSPTKLRELAERWHTKVGGPVSGISANADPSQTTIQRYWEGLAVEAYLVTLPPQKSAIEKLKTDFNDPATKAMTEMATAIRNFWLAVLAIVAALLAELAVALVTLRAGPIGIAVAAAAAVALFVPAITALVVTHNALEGAAHDQQEALLRHLQNDTDLPNGRWPRPGIAG